MGSVSSWFGGGGDDWRPATKAAKRTEETAAEKSETVDVAGSDESKVSNVRRKRASSLGGGADTFGGGALG